MWMVRLERAFKNFGDREIQIHGCGGEMSAGRCSSRAVGWMIPLSTFVKSKFLFLLGLLLAAFFKSTAQPATTQMQIKARGAELELSWPGSLRSPSGVTLYPLF